MAKAGARLIGILTVAIFCNLCKCASNEHHQNDKNTQYESVHNTPSTTLSTALKKVNATRSTVTSIIVPYVNQHLLGVNETGQHNNMTYKTKNSSVTIRPETLKVNDESFDTKNNFKQYPKTALEEKDSPSVILTKASKIVVGHAAGVQTDDNTEEEKLIDKIDVPENETLDALKKNYIKVNQTEDHHHYYNSTIVVDKEKVETYWNKFKNISPNWLLSRSHRRAMTIALSFDFPFYGHPINNVTVATGGFIYTGDYVHSWLAATQYIAPLMANFDTSISNNSFVRLNDTGTSFTVIWESVYLQDKQDVGKFTFSTTLHKNGDIVFTYFSVPIFVNAIQDDKHPVKVGLSDAYIIDKVVYLARRKTIYEYHRVNFAQAEITNFTIITLKALPTCLEYTDCGSCVNHVTAFNCTWCPIVNRCSTGTDRKKQDWLGRGCGRNFVNEENSCPAIGQKGNNVSQNNTTSPLFDDGIDSSTIHTPLHKPSKDFHTGTHLKSSKSKSIGVTLGVFVPTSLISCAILWILYAYRNPHTRSGQFLIQYRPSQWSWRRGEARYTAATIHM